MSNESRFRFEAAFAFRQDSAVKTLGFVARFVHLPMQVDKFNPAAASRLAKVFMTMKDYNYGRQVLMTKELKRLLGEPDLSDNVREVASRALGLKVYDA